MADQIKLRSRLCRTGSLMTMAMAMLAFPAAIQAQAYEGNPAVVQGTVDIDRTNPGQDIFTVDTPSATINWTPTDTGIGGGEIDFLPAGFQALYQNNPALISDFVVLNRILPNDPSRPIALNGNVISQLQGAAGAATGGTVWFYSPGGVIVGSTATFDIGSLLLTTGDPVFAPGPSNDLIAPNTATSGSMVDIRNGATINALTEGSYIAAIAPAITQAGSVNVNGDAVYAATEQSRVRFRTSGLVDVEIVTGSDGLGGVPIRHLGTTTGPASSGTGDNHRIILAAMPKNDAITMVIGAGSELGFDIAGAADVDGNAVILSSGYEVFGDFPERSTVLPVNSNIQIDNANFSSSLIASADGTLSINSTGADLRFSGRSELFGFDAIDILSDGTGSNISFDDNLTLISVRQPRTNGQDGFGGDVSFVAQNDAAISVAGDTTIFADATGQSDFSGQGGSGFGGNVLFQADSGGNLTFTRNLSIGARGSGSGGLTPGDGTGGTIRLLSTGGNSIFSVGDTASLDADGRGGQSQGVGTQAGVGLGGTVEISATGGVNQINAFDTIRVMANGVGGLALTAGSKSGDSIGGTAILNVDGGSSISASTLSLFASGIPVQNRADIEGNDSIGGMVVMSASGNGSIVSGNQIQLLANGSGGNGLGANGGNGTGGSVDLTVSDGAVTNFSSASGPFTFIQSLGFAGDATGTGFQAGMGTAGQVNILADNGGLNFLAPVNLFVIGSGGIGNMADGGSGFGGTVSLVANGANGSVNFADRLNLQAEGRGREASGGPGNGGSGTAGTIRIQSQMGASIMTARDVGISANGSGADGSGIGNSGGQGNGGAIELIADGGNIVSTSTRFELRANAFTRTGSLGADGGSGQGGSILVESRGTGLVDLATLGINAQGAGGFSDGGISGDGSGGSAIVRSVDDPSIISVSGSTLLNASAAAGNSFFGTLTGNVNGADGIGGTTIVEAINGTLNAGDHVSLGATGQGGRANGIGVGGDGTGGTVRVAVRDTNGRLNFANDVSLNVQGIGGSANGSGGTAGTGIGGDVELISNSGFVNVGARISAVAFGSGGSGMGGASGSAGRGGNTFVLADGGTVNAVVLEFMANGIGGSAGNGGMAGNGFGGTSLVTVRGSTVSLDRLTTQAIGRGGSLLDSMGVPGEGSGGLAEILVFSSNTSSLVDARSVIASASGSGSIGHDGVDGPVGSDGSDGGDGFGGTARILVDAGNARLNALSNAQGTGGISVFAGGNGGVGGAGGIGSSGAGGRGGNGGSGTGGTAILGTMSNAIDSSNNGAINTTVAVINSSGRAENGRDGGAGSVQGDGGDGGTAISGSSQFIMRGGTANFETLRLFNKAFIGEGGAGANSGMAGTFTPGSALFDIGPHSGSGAGATLNSNFTSAGSANGRDFSGSLDVVVNDSIANFGSLEVNEADNAMPGGQSIDIMVSNGELNFDNASARMEIAGDIDVILNNGTLSAVSGLGLINKNGVGSISLTGNGSLQGPGNFSFFAGNSFLSDLDINTAGQLTVTAGDTVTFNNNATARIIRVSADDVDLANNIIFGDGSTERIEFGSTSTNGTILGGDGSGSGFILDQNEIALTRAQDIFFTVDNDGLEIRDLNLQGFDAGSNANLTQADSEFAIAANGLIRVNGNVMFGNMTDGNILSIESAPGSGLEVAADTGGIFLEGNSPGGTLLLSADFIHVAETSLLGQLAMDPNFAGRDDALAMSPVTARPDGVISARHIDFNVAERLLIQNSGTDFEFAGFHAATGEVNINNISQPAGDIDMVIFGQLENPDGTFITNENVRDALFDPLPGAGFTTNSGVSGCALTAAACQPVAPPPPPDPGPDPNPDPDPGPDPSPDDPVDIAPDIRDRIENEPQNDESNSVEEETDETNEESATTDEEEEAIEKATSRSPIVRPVTIVDTRPLDSETVVDEPVTGGGNPGLIGLPDSDGDIETDLRP